MIHTQTLWMRREVGEWGDVLCALARVHCLLISGRGKVGNVTLSLKPRGSDSQGSVTLTWKECDTVSSKPGWSPPLCDFSRRLTWGEPGLHSVSMSLTTRWGDGFGSASVSSIDPDEIQKALPSQGPAVVPGSTWCRGLGTQNLVPRIRGSRGSLWG